MMQQQLDFFREQGYLIVPGAITGRQLTELTRELEIMRQAVDSGAWRGNHLFEEPGVARVIFGPYDHCPTLRHLVNREDMVALAKGMLGGPIHLHHTKLMCKVAHKGTPQPPHQDYHYWQGNKPNQVAVFVCIDPCTEANGCLRVFGGSHTDGLLPHHEEYHPVTGERHWVCNVPPAMAAREVKFEGQPGDLVFFGSLTVHWSTANHSSINRRGVIWEYDELGNLPPQNGWGAPIPAVSWT